MSSHTKARSTAWVFWLVYALVVVLLFRDVPQASSMMNLMANDDLVRLVEIRDWLNGQGWADLMQYRMGPEGGTLMHWSRLVDAPIAAIIRLAAIVLPMAQAEALAMVVWPLALSGGLLVIFRQGGRALGGESAGNFAMLMGALALLATQKFDAGSLDHHNLQLIVIMGALSALVVADSGLKTGAIAGVACAVSLAIGLEAILFVAVLAVYVAIMWVATGQKARAQALGFSLAFSLGLAALFLLLRPDFSATAFRCDAFGPELLWVGLAGALGLAGLVTVGGGLTLAKRVVGIVILAVVVFAITKAVSPYCLTNPLDQLSNDVATLWLSRIEEARPLLTYVKLNNGQNAGLLISPLVVMGIAAWLALDRRFTARALLMLAMVAIAYGMALYQLRGASFLMVLSGLPAAAGLAEIYHKYRSGSQKAGFVVLILLVLSLPQVPTVIAYEYLFSQNQAATTAQVAALPPEKTCLSQASFDRFSTASPGMVLANTNMGAQLLAYTPHAVLTSNFHRNNAGIQAGIDIGRAALADVPSLLTAADIRYVAYCAGDGSLNVLASWFPDGMWASLDKEDVPNFLAPLFQDGLIVYEVITAKDP